MFFKTKRNARKTTRQTLSTEQLEPKAMFSVSPVEPVVALDVGPVNQAGYDCTNAGACPADGFMKIGDIKGEVKPTQRVGNDGRSIVHPSFNVGNDGRSIVHPSFNVGLDGYIATTEDANEASFNVGNDGRSIVHPQFNVGNDGRMIVHPSFNVGLDGYIATTEDANEASFNVGNDGRSIVHPQFNVGNDGRSIVHPSFNVGNNVLAQANQQPSLTAIRDVDIASESLAGSANPGGDDVFMPKPNRTDVWTNGSATSLAPRHAAFAMMGR